MSEQREADIAQVVVDWLEREGCPAEPGRVLVVDDDANLLARPLKAAGATVSSWRRRAYVGKASAWPPLGEVDWAIVRLPRDWPGFAMQVHAVAARLRPGGRLWIYGGNDEGIKSAPRHLADLDQGFVAETLWIKQRVRILEATRPADFTPKGELSQWRQELSLDLPGVGPTPLVSYPGLFAHGRLDEASALLLEALPLPPAGARVLDLGCGAGALSLGLSRRQPQVRLFLADVDSLALAAAAENLPGATLLPGDGWSAVELGARFDLVLSNPPLHRGHGQDLQVLHALIDQAPMRLVAGGRLVLVTWKATGALARMRERLKKVEVLAERSGTVVLSGGI